MLELVSFLSLVFCVLLTLYTSTVAHQGNGQTIKESMIEAWENIVVGFSINFCANLLILPMVPSLGNSHIDPWENFMMGWIYTAISMIRSFVIRRRHNRKYLQKLKESCSG